MLHVRIEAKGPAAERGIARLCAAPEVARDGAAVLGRPVAEARCTGGDAAIALLVEAATLSLDDTDLHITLQRR